MPRSKPTPAPLAGKVTAREADGTPIPTQAQRPLWRAAPAAPPPPPQPAAPPKAGPIDPSDREVSDHGD